MDGGVARLDAVTGGPGEVTPLEADKGGINLSIFSQSVLTWPWQGTGETYGTTKPEKQLLGNQPWRGVNRGGSFDA